MIAACVLVVLVTAVGLCWIAVSERREQGRVREELEAYWSAALEDAP